MAEIKLNNNGEFEVKLNQTELNTIALLLGYSSDELVEDRAESWEITDYCQGNDLSNLYGKFYSKMV